MAVLTTRRRRRFCRHCSFSYKKSPVPAPTGIRAKNLNRAAMYSFFQTFDITKPLSSFEDHQLVVLIEDIDEYNPRSPIRTPDPTSFRQSSEAMTLTDWTKWKREFPILATSPWEPGVPQFACVQLPLPCFLVGDTVSETELNIRKYWFSDEQLPITTIRSDAIFFEVTQININYPFGRKIGFSLPRYLQEFRIIAHFIFYLKRLPNDTRRKEFVDAHLHDYVGEAGDFIMEIERIIKIHLRINEAEGRHLSLFLTQWIKDRRRTPDGPQKRIEISEEGIRLLSSRLIRYFPSTDDATLRKLLSGDEVGEKLIFHGNANQLADAFWLNSRPGGPISVSNKKLIKWIVENFQYHKNGVTRDFKTDNIENCIDTQTRECRKPLPEFAK